LLWYHWYMRASSLRKLRQGLGLSQHELARRLGVARATVTRWENGARHPSKVAQLAIQSIIEGKESRSWQRLAAAAMNELWDNPEDAVYDAWRDIYHPSAR
jgi:transcriptional regulator with XRE-family HTH domain